MTLYVSSQEHPSGIRTSCIRMSRNGLSSRRPTGLPLSPRARFVTFPSVCLLQMVIDTSALRRVSKYSSIGSSCGITSSKSIACSSSFLGMTVLLLILSKLSKKNALSLLGLSWKLSSFSRSEWCDFSFYDHVHDWDTPSDNASAAKIVRWLGVSYRIVSMLCYWILREKCHVLSRTTVLHMTCLDM